MSAISLRGMDTAQQQLEKTARRIAAAPVDDSVELSTEAVSLMQSRNLFEANIAAMKTGGEMQQSLLDELL